MKEKETNDIIDRQVGYINEILNKALEEVSPMVKVTQRNRAPWNKELTQIKN